MWLWAAALTVVSTLYTEDRSTVYAAGYISTVLKIGNFLPFRYCMRPQALNR